MRLLLIFPLICCFCSAAQQNAFPSRWTGNWKGELKWYIPTSDTARIVPMELRIKPTDSAGSYTWQIKYGTGGTDNRPYTLSHGDSAKNHWIINEHNGIILDQYYIGNRLSGAFTVQTSTIINNYWIDDGKLHVEFYNISARPVATTGRGDKDSPLVDSYKVNSYQKAVLSRY